MKPKIMLVDDVSISNIIVKKLISLMFHDVDVIDFTDPCLAYTKLREIEPDLIFLDLNMPYMNGWQFLEKMKSENLAYKVIILTSSSSILDKEYSQQFSNIIDYCEKPLTKEKVYNYISQVLITSNNFT